METMKSAEEILNKYVSYFGDSTFANILKTLHECASQKQPVAQQERSAEETLIQWFDNHSDCYADTWVDNYDTEPPTKVEGQVVRAMTCGAVCEMVEQFKAERSAVVKENLTTENDVQNILQIAHAMTESIWNTDHISCFGNLEVKLQELLLKYFPAQKSSEKTDLTDEIKKQLLNRFGFIDDGVDAENQLKIFSFMKWYKERLKGKLQPEIELTDEEIIAAYPINPWDSLDFHIKQRYAIDACKWYRDQLKIKQGTNTVDTLRDELIKFHKYYLIRVFGKNDQINTFPSIMVIDEYLSKVPDVNLDFHREDGK